MAQLTFCYSTMNAGKSTDVLQIAYSYEKQGKKVLLFVPEVDDRYGKGKITSRIGLSRNAIVIEKDTNIVYEVFKRMLNMGKINCVLVDESQFLSQEQVLQLTQIADDLEIPVIAYGLKNTFNNQLFEGSEALLVVADNIKEIETVCWYCDNKAIMNMRIDESGNAVTEGEIIQIGGNESYIPVCRKCYKYKIMIGRG